MLGFESAQDQTHQRKAKDVFAEGCMLAHDGAADLVLHIEVLLSQASALLPSSYLNFPLKGNFQPFIVALLSIISCIMPYLDNFSIMSSMEDEFAE